MSMEQHKHEYLGDVVRRASEEIRGWPAWAQPFRPSASSKEEPTAVKASSSQGKQPSGD
jgi:hypothetical protein